MAVEDIQALERFVVALGGKDVDSREMGVEGKRKGWRGEGGVCGKLKGEAVGKLSASGEGQEGGNRCPSLLLTVKFPAASSRCLSFFTNCRVGWSLVDVLRQWAGKATLSHGCLLFVMLANGVGFAHIKMALQNRLKVAYVLFLEASFQFPHFPFLACLIRRGKHANFRLNRIAVGHRRCALPSLGCAIDGGEKGIGRM